MNEPEPKISGLDWKSMSDDIKTQAATKLIGDIENLKAIRKKLVYELSTRETEIAQEKKETQYWKNGFFLLLIITVGLGIVLLAILLH